MDEINTYILPNVHSLVKMTTLHASDWPRMLSCTLLHVTIRVKVFHRPESLILRKANTSTLVIPSSSSKMIVQF